MKPLSEFKSERRLDGRPGIIPLRIASNVVAHEIVTLGTRVFEFTADGTTTTPGSLPVNVSSGLTPAIVTPLLAAKIVADYQAGQFNAEVISNNEILLSTKRDGLQVNVSTNMSGANNGFGGVATTYGERASGVSALVRAQRAANAQEAALGTMHFQLNQDFVPASVDVSVVGKAWGGTVAIVNSRVTLTNTGATNFVAGDVVKVTAAN